MKDSTKLILGAAIAIILAVTFFIPYDHYDRPITSKGWVSEAVVAEASKEGMIVQLKSSGQLTETYLLLEGSVPTSVQRNQEVLVGYPRNGLPSTLDYYETPKVQVAFLEKGNVLMDCILAQCLPIREAARSYEIVDYKWDGTELLYNQLAKR